MGPPVIIQRFMLANIIMLYLILWAFLAASVQADSIDDADIHRDIHEIIGSRGFLSEPNFVTTSDGYVLQLVRIINPFEKNRTHLKPVLLFHGFQCTGSFWIITSLGRLMDDGHYYELDDNDHLINCTTKVCNTLGFVLATKGYDVWLANYRGSAYSTNHTNLSTDSPDYWSFSIDEMASVDLPLIIDYIRVKTKHPTISYIGHSQGNFIMLALQSMKPEYSDVIKPFIALSPVFYLGQVFTPLRFYIPLKEVLRLHPTMVPFRETLRHTYNDICKDDYARRFCYNIYQYFLGGNQSNLNMKRFNVYMANVPLGSSSWNAAHLFQMMEHGNPAHFDYGPFKNWLKYGSTRPPFYDASKINSTDIALFYLKYDYFNHLNNVEQLKNQLKVKLIEDYQIPDETFGHMDLVWSKHSGQLVNTRLLNILSKY